MSILKRGKIAAVSLVVMLVVAGYINYKYDPTREENLGKTIYVNGKDSFTYETVSIYSEEENASSISTESSYEETKQNDDTLAVFRYDRDNMIQEIKNKYGLISRISIEDLKNKSINRIYNIYPNIINKIDMTSFISTLNNKIDFCAFGLAKSSAGKLISPCK